MIAMPTFPARILRPDGSTEDLGRLDMGGVTDAALDRATGMRHGDGFVVQIENDGRWEDAISVAASVEVLPPFPGAVVATLSPPVPTPAEPLFWTDPSCMGLIPSFFDAADPRPALEQLRAAYEPHGGPVRPSRGAHIAWGPEPWSGRLGLPGADRAWTELSRGALRDEVILFFEGEFLAIVQPDGSTFTARIS